MAEPAVWRLGSEELAEAAAILTRAFLDEPVVLATFPKATASIDYLQLRLTGSVRYSDRFGEVWGVGPQSGEMVGAAAWVREPRPQRTPALSTELGYPVDAEGDAAMDRVNAMLAGAEAEFGEMPPVWRSLDMIAISPEWQGQGFGSVLMHRLLTDAASAGEVMALVTDREVNVPFYTKVGLDLPWSGRSDDGKVPLWSFRTKM